METIIGFIRHGQSFANKNRIFCGQSDSDLTNKGIRQAKKAAKGFKSKDWDIIISSDLKRAFCTAEIIANASGIPLEKSDKRLRERYLGKVEGVSWDEIADLDNFLITADKGQESNESFNHRCYSFISDIERKYKARKVLLVTHGCFIRTILRNSVNYNTVKELENLELIIIAKRKDVGWKRISEKKVDAT